MSEPELPSLYAASPRRWAVAGAGKAETLSVSEDATAGLELFQNTLAVDGYARWKAEAAQARAAEELPAQANGAGYAAWKSEAEAARRAFEQRWGVPLGRPVRVQLRGEAQEREGCLFVAEEAPQGRGWRLRLGTEVFEASRIESVARVDA